uniref:Uncharacterized protein n=1 Tax=Acrobeloides nanus TaxID=290746 RepID=A0A914CBX6_9BILA
MYRKGKMYTIDGNTLWAKVVLVEINIGQDLSRPFQPMTTDPSAAVRLSSNPAGCFPISNILPPGPELFAMDLCSCVKRVK